jgi:hypothetical protein
MDSGGYGLRVSQPAYGTNAYAAYFGSVVPSMDSGDFSRRFLQILIKPREYGPNVYFGSVVPYIPTSITTDYALRIDSIQPMDESEN